MIESKSKVVIYLSDTLDPKWFKNLKPETFQPSDEPESYVFGNIQNIMRDQQATLYYTLPNPKNQILQLI